MRIALWTIITMMSCTLAQMSLTGTDGNFSREMVCTLTIYPTANSICWDSQQQKETYISTGLYSPRDMLPTRFQTFHQTTFLAFPRYRCGVPATLMALRMDDFCRIDPLLSPFPSWPMNNLSEEWSMINVIDLVMDDNDTLWVLDIGVINTLTEPLYVSGPAVYGFCPTTGSVRCRIALNPLICKGSRLQHIQAEVTPDGNTYLYISDAGTSSIIVWNVGLQVGFKVKLPPDLTNYPLSKDVLYMALVRKECQQSALYLTYLMGAKMYTINTCHIRNGFVNGAVTSAGRKPGPMVILGTDGGRTVYLRMRAEREIFLWNTDREFRPRSLVLVRTEATNRLATQVSAGYRRLVWMLESNFPDYMDDVQGSLGVLPRLVPLANFCDNTQS